jgi:AAA domain, putative AbiEii toxin, Type IV TA system
MTSISKKEAGWWERDGSNLASWYRSLAQEDPEAADAIKVDMREIIDRLQHFRLAPAGGTAKELFATVAGGPGEGRKPYDLALEELSLGQRQLLALYAILHGAARRATVVCFDEPDNFVALREIQPWLVKISDALEESGGQLLVISHHPEVIDYLAAGSAFKFERPTGDVARVKPLAVDRDSGLKASEALDGDRFGVEHRKRQLAQALADDGKEPRKDGDRIALCVPTWSIETWFAWLCGLPGVTESTRYKHDAALKDAQRRGVISPSRAAELWLEGPREGEARQVPSLSDARKEMERLG